MPRPINSIQYDENINSYVIRVYHYSGALRVIGRFETEQAAKIALGTWEQFYSKRA